MVTIKGTSLLGAAIFFAGISFGQNPALDQFLKNGKTNADAVNKNHPAPREPQKKTLPPGDDNSWRITASLNRTVTAESNLVSKDPDCREKKTSSFYYSVQSNLSTNRSIGWVNGDDFTVITDVDADLKTFVDPLTGHYEINSHALGKNTSCMSGSDEKWQANSTIDVSGMSCKFQL